MLFSAMYFCFSAFLPRLGAGGYCDFIAARVPGHKGPPPLPTSAFHLTVLTPTAPPTTPVDVRQWNLLARRKKEKNEMKGAFDVVPLGSKIRG